MHYVKSPSTRWTFVSISTHLSTHIFSAETAAACEKLPGPNTLTQDASAVKNLKATMGGFVSAIAVGYHS